MSLKEVINEEMNDLKKVKRPYESVAFVLFAILLGQQLIYLVYNLIEFISKNKTFLPSNGWITSNLMGFITRILNLGSSNWFYIILAIVAFVLYYFLIYIFVWNYCRKERLAKWTWTLFIVFGPTILFIPPYIFFVVYVFRAYFARFAKRFVEEFKRFNPDDKMTEDVHDEPKEETNEEITE